jgi:hypothetical protein
MKLCLFSIKSVLFASPLLLIEFKTTWTCLGSAGGAIYLPGLYVMGLLE